MSLTLDHDSGKRAPRFRSHVLAEVRRVRWWPFGIRSAVLLDLSEHGFKLELTSSWDLQAGHRLWLGVPLGPLGILSPNKLQFKIEVRWFDRGRFRVGGTFCELKHDDEKVMRQVVAVLRSRSG